MCSSFCRLPKPRKYSPNGYHSLLHRLHSWCSGLRMFAAGGKGGCHDLHFLRGGPRISDFHFCHVLLLLGDVVSCFDWRNLNLLYRTCSELFNLLILVLWNGFSDVTWNFFYLFEDGLHLFVVHVTLLFKSSSANWVLMKISPFSPIFSFSRRFPTAYIGKLFAITYIAIGGSVVIQFLLVMWLSVSHYVSFNYEVQYTLMCIRMFLHVFNWKQIISIRGFLTSRHNCFTAIYIEHGLVELQVMLQASVRTKL